MGGGSHVPHFVGRILRKILRKKPKGAAEYEQLTTSLLKSLDLSYSLQKTPSAAQIGEYIEDYLVIDERCFLSDGNSLLGSV
jgi:hypothetical protein